MKTDIHPTYFAGAKAICTCGTIFEYGNTVKETKVEVCSKCHPFYTGKKKILDSGGRVQQYMDKMQKAADAKKDKADKEKAKNEKKSILDEIEEEKEKNKK